MLFALWGHLGSLTLPLDTLLRSWIEDLTSTSTSDSESLHALLSALLGWDVPSEGGVSFRASLPYLAAAALLVWWLTERLAIDDEGARLFLFRPKDTMYSARWDRVRFLDVIRHAVRPATIVVHDRSRFLLPFSVGIHFDRYGDPKAVIRAVLDKSSAHGVRTREWTSTDRVVWAACAFVFLGALAALGERPYSAWLMKL